MPKINAGVVLVTKFVSSDSAVFSNYIEYMNRSNAVRNENIDKYTIPTLDNEIKQYNEYMEYMADSKKTTELFTNQSDRLSAEEKEKLKDIFQLAQNNGSLMWQTVISFDNKWLAENSLYDPQSGILNEIKLKEYARASINTMLSKENMDKNSVWNASIHYNTDNIHIHVATVQPIPLRETKTIKTVRFNSSWVQNTIGTELLNTLDVDKTIKAHKTVNKNYITVLNKIKEEIYKNTGKQCELGDYLQLNNDGTLDISYYGSNDDIPYMAQLQSEIETQKGVFKESSIEAGKSKIVNQILGQNLINDKINTLMRDSLINDLKSADLINSNNLKQLYYDIYQKLPSNKRLWQYNNNVMTPLRSQIDKFTTEWLKQYHYNDYEKLNNYLVEQESLYQTAYGGNKNHFAENKIKDLYGRCGNIIIKKLKELSNSELIDLSDVELLSAPESLPEPDELSELNKLDELNELEQSTILSVENIDEYLNMFSDDTFLEFSQKYKKAKLLLYGTKNITPDQQMAFELFEEEAQKGNIYALYDLASCYQKGVGCATDTAIAQALFRKAFTGFQNELEKAETDIPKSKKEEKRLFNQLNSLKYRIGKMYYYGQGIEIDKNTAFKYFKDSSDYLYSKFYIAKFYENGEKEVVKKDSVTAFKYYKSVCYDCENNNKSMPFSFYKTAYMLENGIGTNVDEKEAYKFYQKALEEFKHSIEKRPDDFLLYRIGTMYLNGKGCDKDIPKALDYLEQAVNAGNDMAACTLAMTYIKNNAGNEKVKKAFEILHNSADNNNNALAQFNLGKLYLENAQTEKEGIKYLQLSAEQGNQFAQYKLGAYLFQNELTREKGISYLTQSAEQGNQFAQYRLGSHLIENEHTRDKGISYLLSAAKQNNQFAQYKLGSFYLKQGDPDQAIPYLLDAAEQGNIYANFKLGTYYAKCETFDFNQAEMFLLKAVGNNFSAAEYNLGMLYLSDKQSVKHFLKGIDYLKTAAEQNNQFAQYQLGKLYFYGNNYLAPDKEQALKYLYAAAEQGNQGAQYLLNKKTTKKRNRIYLRRFHLPHELNQSFYNLISELGRDYRTHDNIRNQVDYEKLQQQIEEEKE